MRWFRSCLAALTLVGMCATSWAQCVQGIASPVAQQMSCCKNGHHTCGMKDGPENCCKTSGPHRHEISSLTTTVKVKAPVLAVVSAWAPSGSSIPVAVPRFQPSQQPSPPKFAASPPAYIAFSTLLI